MTTTVDARGLSCPQPVIMALGAMKNAMKNGNEEELVVLVDTDTSKENVSRAAASQGWQVLEVIEENQEYRITIRKG